MPGVKKPNYFLGIKITNPALLENVDKIQKQIIAENTGVAAFLEPPSKSHITLAVMNLSPDELEACGSLIAEKFKPGFTVKQRTVQYVQESAVRNIKANGEMISLQNYVARSWSHDYIISEIGRDVVVRRENDF